MQMNYGISRNLPRENVVTGGESGMSLMVVMVALVIMSIGAIGLIRMVDTSALVAGNMAFKQSTTSTADGAAERGIPVSYTHLTLPTTPYV